MLTMCAGRFLEMVSKRKRSSKGGADEGGVEGKSDVDIADTSMSSMGMASEPIAGDTLSREERRKLKKQRKKAAKQAAMEANGGGGGKEGSEKKRQKKEAMAAHESKLDKLILAEQADAEERASAKGTCSLQWTLPEPRHLCQPRPRAPPHARGWSESDMDLRQGAAPGACGGDARRGPREGVHAGAPRGDAVPLLARSAHGGLEVWCPGLASHPPRGVPCCPVGTAACAPSAPPAPCCARALTGDAPSQDARDQDRGLPGRSGAPHLSTAWEAQRPGRAPPAASSRAARADAPGLNGTNQAAGDGR